MKPKCQYGNHRWDQDSKDGSHCLDCKKEFGVRRRKEKPAGTPAPAPAAPAGPAAQTVAAKAPNEALRAKWGLNPPAQAAPQPQPAQPEQTAQPEKPDENKVDVSELVKESIPDLVVAGEQKVIRKLGHCIPNDPHPKLKEKFEESFEKWCRGKGPKIEMPPGWAALTIAGALLLQMWIGADPLPAPARAKTSASGTDGKPDSTPYPTSSSQTPELSLVPDSGGVIGADANASDE